MKAETSAQALGGAYQRAKTQTGISSDSDPSRVVGLRARVLSEAFVLLMSDAHGPSDRSDQLARSAFGSLQHEAPLEVDLLRSLGLFVQLDQVELGERRVLAAHRLGELLDLLLASERGVERRRLGSYFTPHLVARELVRRSFVHVLPRLQRAAPTLDTESALLHVCDPACGGGAFLVEAVRQIAQFCSDELGLEPELAWRRAVAGAYGIDISPLAIATSRAVLSLLAPSSTWAGAHQLLVGDALVDKRPGRDEPSALSFSRIETPRFDVSSAFERVFSGPFSGFDWIVGNPPWVAFQGRATQHISPELRAFYRARYLAFTGYPTTQGMFAERAAELAPQGVISLLVPSSLSDLDGYQNARRRVTSSHQVAEPLLEFGQDAFEQVVQPCFGLIASAREERTEGSGAAFQLEERARLDSSAARVEPPSCLVDLWNLPPFPPETFGELGFQSNTKVVRTLFRRVGQAEPPFTIGLLEGRCVQEFRQTPPRVFINPDPEVLRPFKARLREVSVYQRVDFVVRQTASFTIAARHQGQYFRNSLIAGYATADLDADVLVGLLNSALYRCLHLSRQRDARQATFPQVKVAHLRSLPTPPRDNRLWDRVRTLSAQATAARALSPAARQQLDQAVFDLFGLSTAQSLEILEYLRSRAPQALASRP
jgi:hypothetical protein